MGYPQTGIKSICGLFGKTRQAWYVHQWSDDEDMLRDAIVIKRVKEIRKQMPRIGTRKLHYLLTETLQRHNISIGRNTLFDLLAEYQLLVRRRKRRRTSTTDSNHPFRKYPNLVRDLQVVRPNHLWVSDITYISLIDNFCYLSLVTDAYSRKIVGHCLHPTLKKEGPITALKIALSSLSGKPEAALIHHSDRGLQYCCTDYITLLDSKKMAISMTERGDPYENALAERVNGILKDEFLLDGEFDNFEQALVAVNNAINTYNSLRPHASCNYQTPDQTHQQQGLLPMRWKKRKREELVIE
jgi:putative transposase